MHCQLCGKKIGPVRRFVDHEYCSPAHRTEARTSLDRGLADIEDNDESWAVSRRRASSSNPSAQAASVLLLAVAAVLILATLSFSGGGGTGPLTHVVASSAPPAPTTASNSFLGRLGDSVGRTLRSSTPATLNEDFKAGLSEWVSASSRASTRLNDFGSDWTFNADGLKPGKLRIWKRSTSLVNYEFDFLGQIDRKSMGWAFRALDGGNYYGAKLTILRAGSGANAGLVRYVMLNGREQERVHLPLPINLSAGETYRVRVNVHDNRFVTTVNGQVVSSWSDGRLRRGGVGFFNEDGEGSLVKWVSVSERDSLLGRVVAYFSLIRLPLPEPASPAFEE